ncbi:MAG TPA: M48 family metalloprotease [Geminicoccaceae bacterium]
MIVRLLGWQVMLIAGEALRPLPPAVPGPVDRESFADAQRRHRRAAKLFTVLVVLGLVLTGLPLAGILFPLLFGLAVLALDVLSLVVTAPDLAGMLDATGGLFAEGPEWLMELIAVGLIVFMPGVLAMLLVWLAVRAIVVDAGMAGVAARLGARPPRPGDLEERQLRNLVDEMAIAAGLPPPALVVLDSPAITGAAFGPSDEAATILISRGLLDRCDRDETQGVIAHLIAMIGNGDQRIALLLISLFATVNLTSVVLKAPFSPRSRALLGQVLRFALQRRANRDPAQEAVLVEHLLDEPPDDDLKWFEKNRLLLFLTLPLYLASGMFSLVSFLTSFVFLSPTFALMLRRRRYLADATAVQLTRNPEGLAQAIVHLMRQHDVPLTGVREAAPLFIVPPRMAASGHHQPIGMMFDVHPPAGKRRDRLMAMGQGLVKKRWSWPKADLRSPKTLLVLLLAAMIPPLMAVAVYLMLVLIVACTMLSIMVGLMWIGFLIFPIHLLLH